MIVTTLPTVQHRPIRAFFRVLAGIIAILGTVVVMGTGYRIGSGAYNLTIGNVLILPLMIGFTRLTYHAAVYGKSPQKDLAWPFASRRVAEAYLLVLLAYYLARP